MGTVTGSGAGQTIAIIDAYDDPNIVGDLHQFDLQFGLHDPPSSSSSMRRVRLAAAGGVGLDGLVGGGSLDVEWAHAVAPQANIILFEANSTSDPDLITTAVNTAQEHARRVGDYHELRPQ